MFDLKNFSVPEGFRGKRSSFVILWWFVQRFLFKPSPQIMYAWRRWLLRCFGAAVGRGVLIRPSASFTYPWKVSIGDYSWIGDDVVIYSLGFISIGNNSVISQKSYLCAGSHDYRKETFDITSPGIKIGDGCWIATDVYIGPGVEIVDESIVGARSSVFKSITSQGLYFGSPAQRID